MGTLSQKTLPTRSTILGILGDAAGGDLDGEETPPGRQCFPGGAKILPILIQAVSVCLVKCHLMHAVYKSPIS